jgi:hypothetical protein
MGYLEKVLGDNEQLIYRTHQHPIVLLERIAGWLLAFLGFVALLIVILVSEDKDFRRLVGIIALCSLVLPVAAIIIGWRRGEAEQGHLFKRVWWPILAGISILAIALTLIFASPTLKVLWILALLVALIPLFKLVIAFLDWLNERYIITNRRVMQTRGIFNKQVSDSALEKVNDVELKQSVVGRLLRYGTVEIITGSDVGVNLFQRISNPVRFKRAMLNAKEGVQARAVEAVPGPSLPAYQAAPPAPGAPAAAGNVGERIVELTELRQKGMISEAEFQAKRKELLDQL